MSDSRFNTKETQKNDATQQDPIDIDDDFGYGEFYEDYTDYDNAYLADCDEPNMGINEDHVNTLCLAVNEGGMSFKDAIAYMNYLSIESIEEAEKRLAGVDAQQVPPSFAQNFFRTLKITEKENVGDADNAKDPNATLPVKKF